MENIDARDAVQAVFAAGGVPVLAHPGQYGNDAMVPALVEIGGIEVWHPLHIPQHEQQARFLATKYNLIMTGGSDFHGDYGEKTVVLGSRSPGIEVVEALKGRRARLQTIKSLE